MPRLTTLQGKLRLRSRRPTRVDVRPQRLRIVRALPPAVCGSRASASAVAWRAVVNGQHEFLPFGESGLCGQHGLRSFRQRGLLQRVAAGTCSVNPTSPPVPHPPTFAPLVDSPAKPRHAERSRPRLGIRASIVYTSCVIPQPRSECPSACSLCASPNSCGTSCCSCCPFRHSR